MGQAISSKVKNPAACVVASLESHFKRTRLLAIRNQHPGRRLKVEMRLYRSGPDAAAKGAPLEPGINDVFAPGGDKLWVEVVNHERRRISLSILEVGPGGRVGDVFDGADVSIEASDGKAPEVWSAGAALSAPEGRYTLKLIATPERTDFSPLAFKVGDRCDLRRDRVTTRGSCKGLTCLFDALSPRTRGNLTSAPPKWTTITAEFTVKR